MRYVLVATASLAIAACANVGRNSHPSTSSSTGGTGGIGGALLCAPGATQPCYDGPAGTADQGICKSGTRTCAADGMSWEACVGQVQPQTENCATPGDDDCDGFSPECTGTHLWSRRFGDASDQLANAVAVDSAGNVIIAGQFSGTIDFGGGIALTSGTPTATDAFVAKLDPTGVVVWARRFGGTGSFRSGQGVAVDGDGNVVVCGEFYGAIDFGEGALTSAGFADVFVAKLGPGGAVLWGKRFGSPSNDSLPAVAVDMTGNVILVGTTNDALDFGGGVLPANGGADLVLAKLDAAGQHLWSKRFGDAAAQQGRAVAVSKTGHVVVAGQASGSIDFGCGALPDTGGGDVVVAELDSSGTCTWSKRFGDTSTQDVTAVAVDGSGNVVVSGNFHGAIDFGGGALNSAGNKDVFVAKLDALGAYVWALGAGDGGDQVSTAVALDAAGNVTVAGYFGGSIDFGAGPLISTDFYDVFVAKVDAGTGAHLWSKRFGDAQQQVATAVAVTPTGDVMLTGYFDGTIDLGGNTLKSAGGSDIFIGKLSQ